MNNPVLCILVLETREWSDSDPGSFRYAKKAQTSIA